VDVTRRAIFGVVWVGVLVVVAGVMYAIDPAMVRTPPGVFAVFVLAWVVIGAFAWRR
jgi:hypothetical protein